MFCPNCGHDCNAAKFCPECGQDLRAGCDASPERADIPAPPVGKYEGTLGYMELSAEGVTIHKKILFKTVERVIPYREIYNVAYKQAKGLGVGFLAIREKKDKLLPVATSANAASDETALSFGSQVSDVFYGIYSYLENYVDQSDVSVVAKAPAFAEARPKPAEVPTPKKEVRPAVPNKPVQKSVMSVRNEKKAELERSGVVYCPKCLSTSISGDKKGFGIGKAVVGAATIGAIGLTAGNIGAKKVICTCLKCGHQWKAGK